MRTKLMFFWLLVATLLCYSVQASITVGNQSAFRDTFLVTGNGNPGVTVALNPGQALTVNGDSWYKVEREIGPGVYDTPVYVDGNFNNTPLIWKATGYEGSFWATPQAGQALVTYAGGNVTWQPSAVMTPLLKGVLGAVCGVAIIALIVVFVWAAFRWLVVEGKKYG